MGLVYGRSSLHGRRTLRLNHSHAALRIPVPARASQPLATSAVPITPSCPLSPRLRPSVRLRCRSTTITRPRGPHAAPRPPIPELFRPVADSLKDTRHISLEDVLAPIPDSAFSSNDPVIWPKRILAGVLDLSANLPSIIRLLPVIQQHIERSDIREGSRIVKDLLKRLRMGQMLAVVPVVLDLMIDRIRRAVNGGEASLDEAMTAIARLLGSLQKWRFFGVDSDVTTHNGSLPPVINAQALRLVELAINIAETTPSSSSNPVLIGQPVRAYIFSRALLTPAMRRAALEHLPQGAMLPGEWRACGRSAISEAGPESARLARFFFSRARQAEEGMRRGVAQGEMEVSRDEGSAGLALGPGDSGVGAGSALVWSAPMQAAVDQIIVAQCGASVQAVVEKLGPYLGRESREEGHDECDGSSGIALDSLRPYAWSSLVHRLAISHHSTSADLVDIASSVPDDLTLCQVMTPIIRGLIARGDLEPAWNIFNDLSHKQRAGAPLGQYVDRVLLAAVTPLCAQLHGMDAAIKLIDEWGKRPKDKINRRWRRSINLDDVNLQALIQPCIRAGRPSLPLRLVAAAQPRWGIWPDHICLNLLLDSCRFTNSSGNDPDTVASRFRDLVGGMRFFQQAEADDVFYAMDKSALAIGTHQALLDPEEATWREMMGDVRPWQVARRLFRDVVLGNWPHLEDIRSPLEFGTFPRLVDILRPHPAAQLGELRHPLPAARYPHIIPAASTFQSYITLLGYWGLTEEIPVTLAWARNMGVEPNWKSMCSALAFIGEAEGPRRRIRGWTHTGGSAFVRDEEIMRRWLESWVLASVPSEAEVAAFVKRVGSRMTADSRWGDNT